jgi:small subunit ribosomal protein S20
MAHHKSAKKRIRRNARRTEINGARRSRIRTFINKVEAAIAGGKKDDAAAALKAAQPEIQRGVTKGVLHKNTAGRRISRLNARIKAMS